MYPNYNLNASANKVSPPYKSTISLLEYFNIKLSPVYVKASAGLGRSYAMSAPANHYLL